MRPRTQTLIIGFLIILLAFGHLIKPATNYLMLPVGRILAFGGSVYVGLTVNPVIGLLMALVCLQAMSDFYVVEHLTAKEVADAQETSKQKEFSTTSAVIDASAPECTCPPEYPEFVSGQMICKDADGKTTKPTMCRCDPGYAYDVVASVCKQNSVMSSPIPALAPPPEGAETVTPEPGPRPPPMSSVRPMPIPLTAAEKSTYYPSTQAPAEPAPAE